MRPIRCVLLALVIGLAAPAGTARAFDEFVGIRPLGMGGGSRAYATGDAAPLLNPSGIALTKSYSVEAAYAFASPRTDHYFHASVVDSTSAFNIGGALYYTYHPSYPTGLPSGFGHEGGVSLSLPLGEYLAIGGTLKYFRLSGSEAPGGHDGGFTFDVGATVRPTKVVSLAVVGQNLRDLDNGQAPQAIGYGVAVLATPDLLLAADGLTRLSADSYNGRKGTSVMAGADLGIDQRFNARLGGGYDSVTATGYGSAGLSLASEIGAIDLGIRQDIFRGEIAPGVVSRRATIVGISLRLFVSANQAAPPGS